MASKCYWCEDSTQPGYLPNPVGQKNEPLGCCKQCQVLACGYHAQRHPNKQEYKCFDCLYIKVKKSALIGLSTSDKQILAKQDFTYFPVPGEIFVDHYMSFEEFKDDNPAYKDWFQDMENTVVDFSGCDFSIREILKKLSSDEKKLLAAANLIISRTYDNKLPIRLLPSLNIKYGIGDIEFDIRDSHRSTSEPEYE